MSIKIVIIGAGPAGLFAAYELVEKLGKNNDILVIDKGKSPTERHCSALEDKCTNCEECEMICGGGGAGMFSDGKLILDLRSGGRLEELLSPKDIKKLEIKISSVIEKYKLSAIYKKPKFNQEISNCFKNNELKFKPNPVLHIGSRNLRNFTSSFISFLKRHNVNFLFNTNVSDMKYDYSSKQWHLRISERDLSKKIRSKYVIISVGKEGNFWLTNLIREFGGTVEDNNIYIGIRMEINNKIADKLYGLALDPKISLKIGERKIKTHCFCKHGQILLLKYFNLPLVGGHSPSIETDDGYNPAKFPNSNFAVLYTDKEKCTSEKSLEIMEKINKSTGGNLLVQRLGDYLDDVSTTPEKLRGNSIKPSNSNITYGHISEDLLPGFRDIFISFLERLNSCIPGMVNPDNLLYAPAIEWWMKKIIVESHMEVKNDKNIPNLYVIGDGSGWTQGIFQAAATGIIAAEDITKKIRDENPPSFKIRKITRNFYERDTLIVAKELLGQYLIHNSPNGLTIGRIVETEAYIGPDDPGSHAYKGRKTKRTEIQFGTGGYAYVYQIYGNHFCFNVVTKNIGMPEVVLVRSLEPIEGIELMAKRRGFSEITDKNLINLTNGPGKLCCAMGIDKSLYGYDLCGDKLFITNGHETEFEIVATPRINIDYAGEAKNYPWRFLINNNRFVSKPVLKVP